MPHYFNITSNYFSCDRMQIFEFHACEGMKGGQYLYAVVSLLCFAFGFPASVFIFFEIFNKHRKGTALTSNALFILNLSIMDAIFLVTIPPGMINMFLWHNRTIEAFWNGLFSLNVCGRPLVVACVCCDCYLAVVHPIFYRKQKTLTSRVVALALVWILTMICFVMFSCSYKFFFGAISITIALITVVIIVICDSFIVGALLTSNPSGRNIHPQKQKALQTLIYSLAMTVISYLPPALLFIIGKSWFKDFQIFVCTMGIPIITTYILGSTVMPMLYLYSTGRLNYFRHA